MSTNFILLPFIMYYLDGDMLGLWYIFLSIGGIVTLFDFGFNPAFSRNIAYCWSGATQLIKSDAEYVDGFQEPNMILLKQVIVTCKKIYFVISIVAFLLMLTIGTFYIIYISSNLTGNRHLLAWIIYSIAIFLNLFYGYFATFLRGVGAIKQYNKAIVFSRIFQIAICISLLMFGYDILAAAFSYLAYGLIFRLISRKYFLEYQSIGEKLKKIKGNDSSSDIKKVFEIIWPNAWRDGLVQLSNYLSSQATTIICSVFFSLAQTGLYSIAIQLVAAIANLAGVMYSSQQPALQSAYIRRDNIELLNIMSKAVFIYNCIFILGVLGVSTVGIPILGMIKPNSVISIPVFLGLSIYQFFYKRHSIYASFISNTNSIPYMVAYLVSSIASVLLAIILILTIPKLGIYNIIFAQIIVQMIYNNWKWPQTVYKILGVNPLGMLKTGFIQTYNSIKNK